MKSHAKSATAVKRNDFACNFFPWTCNETETFDIQKNFKLCIKFIDFSWLSIGG